MTNGTKNKFTSDLENEFAKGKFPTDLEKSFKSSTELKVKGQEIKK